MKKIHIVLMLSFWILDGAILGEFQVTRAALAQCNIIPTDLLCEYESDPLGLDVTQPRFLWVLDSEKRGEVQSAYQILVASDEKNIKTDTGDMWNSGTVYSDQSIHIVYSGRKLHSRQKYFWKVRVWDKNGEVSHYSPVHTFEMGLLKPDDWKAQWIAKQPEQKWKEAWSARKVQEKAEKNLYQSHEIWDLYHFHSNPVDPAPLLRKEFEVDKTIKEARVYVTGLGYYELSINGVKVGDHVLDPGFTNYDHQVLYVTYDVTSYLKPGKNAIGVILGRGWYNMITHTPWWYFDIAPWVAQPKMILHMNIQFVDGTDLTIASDGTWKAADSPIIWDCVRAGEIYDARNEKTNWNKPDYNDTNWEMVSIVPSPGGKLVSQRLQPIKVVKTVKPVKITRSSPGVYVYDMGQNMAGWVKLKVKGPQGARVVLTFGECLNSDGTFNPRSGANQFQQAVYILKGEGTEVYEPRFCYYRLQYVQVKGVPGTLTLDDLEGRPVHTVVESEGEFVCSNPMLNQLQHNVRWSILNNLHSIPNGDPHREKIGWTGDSQLTAEAAIYNFNMPLLYTKWLMDLKYEQDENGYLPCVAPSNGWGYSYNNLTSNFPDPWFVFVEPVWTGTYVIITWYLYQYYGDKRVLEEHYENIKRWIDCIKPIDQEKKYIVSGGFGDWLPPNGVDQPKKEPLVGTGYYYYVVDLASRIAKVLEKQNDVRKYAEWAANIKNAFNEEFFNSESDVYHTGIPPAGSRQTSNAIPLFLGIVPDNHIQAVADNLANDIMLRQNGHLTTGFIGTKYLLEVLPDVGHADAAYTIVTRKDYPGWGWHILQGATTIWEAWDGKGSHNHNGTTNVGSYFYKFLAGIRVDPKGVGFKKIIIKPSIEGDLTFVKASTRTIRGVIRSSWEKRDGSLSMEITVPVNSTAQVHVPKMNMDHVTISENGKNIWDEGSYLQGVEGVTGARESEEEVIVEVGSGSYTFRICRD